MKLTPHKFNKGTTIAVALDHVARRYNIKLQSKTTETMNRIANLKSVTCVQNGALWFHHGFKHPWMAKW